MTDEPAPRGLLDTNIMILRSRIAPEELPDEVAISAVTLAELLPDRTRSAPTPNRTPTSRLPSGLAACRRRTGWIRQP
jgi:predicted nucleic acid-binding protein